MILGQMVDWVNIFWDDSKANLLLRIPLSTFILTIQSSQKIQQLYKINYYFRQNSIIYKANCIRAA